MRQTRGELARGVLTSATMNFLFFGMKRAYWGFEGVARRAFRKVEVPLTAARHDMLASIGVHTGILQHELQRMLGVVSSTASEMLKALEELGFVVREIGRDRRHRVVRLTDLGKALLAYAQSQMDSKLELEEDPRWIISVIPGSDGVWSDYLSFPWDDYDDVVPRMQKQLGRAWGPYRAIHPDD